MKYNINRHLNIIRRNKKTTFVGLAVLVGTGIKWGLGAPSPSDIPTVASSLVEVSGTGIKWGLGAPSPSDIPTVASSLVEVLIGLGLLLAKDYDVQGVPHDEQ